MKIVFCFVLLVITVKALAQPPADNPKLKPFIDKFWQYMDEIKRVEASGTGKTPPTDPNKNTEVKSEAPTGGADNITKLKIIADNARKQIEHIKRRDPGYDVSKMEALVRPYIEAQQAAVNTHNARIDALQFHSTDAGCYGLFQKNTTTEFRQSGNIEADTKAHTAQLEDYNRRLDNILKNHMAGVENCYDYIKDRTDAAMKRLADMVKKMAETDGELSARQIFRELLGEAAYWNAAAQLYPDIKAAAEVHSAIQQQLQAVGGIEGFIAKAAARRRERLKNLFMPKAVVVNAAMDAEFKEAFANGGWGETLIKIHLLNREWTIVRNSLTGAIICRTQQAAIVAKQKKGNCILYIYTIKQQYTGSGYSSMSSYYGHDVVEDAFLCENAK